MRLYKFVYGYMWLHEVASITNNIVVLKSAYNARLYVP